MSPESLAPQKFYQEVGAFLEKYNDSKDYTSTNPSCQKDPEFIQYSDSHAEGNHT